MLSRLVRGLASARAEAHTDSDGAANSLAHVFPTHLAGLALCGLAWLAACERKAPGPEECVQFADTWLRSSRRQAEPRLALDNAFDELVVRCLTEPYDRELVSCVVGGAPRERCRIDYARRSELRREERWR